MIRFSISLLLVLFSLSGLRAQNYNGKLDSIWSVYRERRGTGMFNDMRYLKSSQVLSPLFGRGALTEKGKGLLGEAYLNIAANNEALRVLQSMDTSAMAARDVYNLAQALKRKGDYRQSDAAMAKYQRLQTSDSRNKYQVNTAAEISRLKGVTRYRVEPVPFNSAESDFGAYPDGSQLVFASSRGVDGIVGRRYGWKESPYLNVFTVLDSGGVVGQPRIHSAKLRTVYHDGPVSFSPDGQTMYATQNPYRFPGKIGKKQINHFELLSCRRQSDGTWGPLVLLPFNGKGFSTGHAAVSPDGQRLWFASDRPGGYGRSDIYYAARAGDGWGEPVNAGPTVNTEGDEMFPFQGADGVLYFSSNGHLTLGGLDMCMAFKAGDGYVVKNMGCPVNGPGDDFSLYLSPDNRHGYFASNRPGGKGDDDIYRFEVLKPVVLNRFAEIEVLDSKTLKPVRGAELTVSIGGKLTATALDTFGIAKIDVGEADKMGLKAQALGYRAGEQSVTLASENTRARLLLEQLPVWGVYGTVTDQGTGAGIDSVQVVIQAVGNTALLGNMTSGGGQFRNELRPETDYVVTLNSPKYFSKKGSFTTKGRAPGWFDINEFMATAIERIEVNKVIEIPNIYYDLGKWNIRKDAAVELDKVVGFMNDNPSLVIELGSHTDSRGSAVSNQSLSQKRAQSAVDYIVKKGGIASSRISAKGYGESALKNHCADGVTCSEAEHQQNRRTEIRVVGVK